MKKLYLAALASLALSQASIHAMYTSTSATNKGLTFVNLTGVDVTVCGNGGGSESIDIKANGVKSMSRPYAGYFFFSPTLLGNQTGNITGYKGENITIKKSDNRITYSLQNN